MCGQPERVAAQIRALAPEFDDLVLRRRLAVKGVYDEMLVNMNARQIERLDSGALATINAVFREHRALLDHFGYALMEDRR